MGEHRRCSKCNSYLRHDAACFPCAWRAWGERNNIQPIEFEEHMALDQLTQQLVDETMQTLNAPNTALHIEKEVRISPRRMRALILFSQQRMNVQINGKIVTLVEDSDAPESFNEAVADASNRPTLPDATSGGVEFSSEEQRAKFEAWLKTQS